MHDDQYNTSDYSLASIGDMTGDGYPDLLVGFKGGDLGRGEAFLVAGPLAGAVHLPEAYARFTARAGEALGSGGSGGRDFDGDGMLDLVIADQRYDNGGVWITYGPLAGATELTDTEAAWVHGDLLGEDAGSVVAMGDVTGDGQADVVTTSEGLASVSYGAVSPAMLFMITGRGM